MVDPFGNIPVDGVLITIYQVPPGLKWLLYDAMLDCYKSGSVEYDKQLDRFAFHLKVTDEMKKKHPDLLTDVVDLWIVTKEGSENGALKQS